MGRGGLGCRPAGHFLGSLAKRRRLVGLRRIEWQRSDLRCRCSPVHRCCHRDCCLRALDQNHHHHYPHHRSQQRRFHHQALNPSSPLPLVHLKSELGAQCQVDSWKVEAAQARPEQSRSFRRGLSACGCSLSGDHQEMCERSSQECSDSSHVCLLLSLTAMVAGEVGRETILGSRCEGRML